jgi:hypothetical protein
MTERLCLVDPHTGRVTIIYNQRVHHTVTVSSLNVIIIILLCKEIKQHYRSTICAFAFGLIAATNEQLS